MSGAVSPRATRVEAAVRATAADVRELQCGRWAFCLANGKPLEVRASRVGPWLILESELDTGAVTVEPWRLLEANAGLHGAAKIVAPLGAAPRVQAELPVAEEIDLGKRLRQTSVGLRQAAARIAGDGEPCAAAAAAPETLAGVEVLEGLVREAGWSPEPRAGGGLSVQIESRHCGGRVLVLALKDGACLFGLRVTGVEPVTGPCREAMARLLLSAGSVVRMARPVLTPDGARLAVDFQVRFDTLPSAVEIGHGLAALSVAGSLYGREVRALVDPGLAEAYLERSES